MSTNATSSDQQPDTIRNCQVQCERVVERGRHGDIQRKTPRLTQRDVAFLESVVELTARHSMGALRGYEPRTESRTAFFSRAAIALATVGSFLCPSKSRKKR